MKTLSLETATEKPLLALTDSGRLLAAKMLPGGPELSRTLGLEVKQLLADFQPERIAVGTGPGSYTGIRVGAALGKALAFGLNLPLIGFCSLKAFTPPINGSFAIVFDARAGGLYVLKGVREKGLCSFETPERIPLSAAHFDGMQLYSPHAEHLKKKLSFSWLDTSPDPHFLAELIEQEPRSPLALTYLSCPG